MKKSFWLEKWEDNNIGFHRIQVNEILAKYIEKFNLAINSKILVPLCGKSKDLVYLAQKGYQVIGIELSLKAISSFFEENQLHFSENIEPPFKVYNCKDLSIKIFLGDFFELNKELLGKIDFIYDRASLVALPLAMRMTYAEILSNLSDPNTQMLLITTEYNSESSGPPFNVSEKEVRDLYKNKFEIFLMERQNTPTAIANFSNVAYQLIKK